MITIDGLLTAFARNANYVNPHLKALPHTDALLQPPAKGNCILWILGHIVSYRNTILDMLGQPPVIPANEAARFAANSAPVTGEEPGLARFENLLAAFNAAQDLIVEGVRKMSPEFASEMVTRGESTMSRTDHIMSFMRHESYHAGQFEWLREWALHNRA